MLGSDPNTNSACGMFRCSFSNNPRLKQGPGEYNANC